MSATRNLSLHDTVAEVRIRGGQKVAACPGRRVEPCPTPPAEYKFNDADRVNIRLGLLIGSRSASGPWREKRVLRASEDCA